MKAARFDYYRPASLDEALARLDAEPGARLIAGSQSLGPMLNMRLTRPQCLIDISGLNELQQVQHDSDGIRIGAAVTHAQIEDGCHSALIGHPLQAVARDIAYRAVRNRGTVGGSLAHADPAADWVVVLSALDARINVASAQAQRSIPIATFFHGAYTTDLAANEVIVSVTIAGDVADRRWGYVKFCRKPGEFAHASSVVRFEASTGCAQIVIGALDGPPVRLPDLAGAIARGDVASTDRAQLISAIQANTHIADSVQIQLHAVATERALRQAGIMAGETA